MSFSNGLKWVEHLKLVRGSMWNQISPRDKCTLEIIGTTLEFDMSYPVIAIDERKLSYGLIFAEAYWILSGSNKLSEIEPYCKQMREYSDDGKTLAGAYGPRFREQFDYVISKLIGDPNTRQAVMTFWMRNPAPSKDIPCTVSLQFLIRNNYLHLIVHMRSSDTWLGLPYDIFSFSMMAQSVRLMLSSGFVHTIDSNFPALRIGQLTMLFGSSHVYESDLAKIDTFLSAPLTIRTYRDMDLYGLNTQDDLMGWLRDNRNDPKMFLK